MATPLSLRILVPVKRVIDYAVKPRVASSHLAIDTSSAKHSMNPFDELSIEESMRLRERHAKPPTPSTVTLPVSDILAATMGPTKSLDVLRTALAMGADRGLHVDTTAAKDEGDNGTGLEPLTVAKILAQVAREEDRNLIVLGKQSIDDDSGTTGGMLAGLLNWGVATQASQIEVVSDQGNGRLRVTREVDGGVETVEGDLPMVVTTDLRLNQPRYATLPNIMKAKKKKVEKKALADYDIGERRLRTMRVEEPKARVGGGKVDGVQGLIGRLQELGAL